MKKALAVGNCQVSSTLYNAILEVPTLEVTERNEHGLPVTYVPEGRDAAVSYGSLDLKFQNNSKRDIRIEMTSDDTTITAKLIRIIIFFLASSYNFIKFIWEVFLCVNSYL